NARSTAGPRPVAPSSSRSAKRRFREAHEFEGLDCSSPFCLGTDSEAGGRALNSVLIVTDAWYPQINGVVRSLERVSDEMVRRGITVHHLTPEGFHTIALPGYGEIRLSITKPGAVEKLMDRAGAEGIHIATEGPLGLMARRYCLRRGIP